MDAVDDYDSVPRVDLRRMADSLRNMANMASDTDAFVLRAQASTLEVASHLGPHTCDNPDCAGDNGDKIDATLPPRP
jgi:hypothetical protein